MIAMQRLIVVAFCVICFCCSMTPLLCVAGHTCFPLTGGDDAMKLQDKRDQLNCNAARLACCTVTAGSELLLTVLSVAAIIVLHSTLLWPLT